METKYVTIPFDLERAKRITNGKEEGSIVTVEGRNARIVCWDRNDDKYPIVALIADYDDKEYSCYFAINGRYEIGSTTKYDLVISVPEWTTFKDGDIYKTAQGGIAIYNTNYEPSINFVCPYYVGLKCDGELIFSNNKNGFGQKGETTLYITEEDRLKFIDALKASKNDKAKEYLKRFFGIEEKKEYKFEPIQWVLCKGSYHNIWTLCQFSHIEDTSSSRYVTVGGNCWTDCIPYNEETKHLLGTTNKWEE